MEYYIVRDDDIGQEIKDILLEKARAGVQVRFLYDAVGSWQLSKKFCLEMKEAGIEVVAFSPVKMPFLIANLILETIAKLLSLMEISAL